MDLWQREHLFEHPCTDWLCFASALLVIIWQISKEEFFSKQFHFPMLYVLSLNASADWIAEAHPEMDVVYQLGMRSLIDLFKLLFEN